MSTEIIPLIILLSDRIYFNFLCSKSLSFIGSPVAQRNLIIVSMVIQLTTTNQQQQQLLTALLL